MNNKENLIWAAGLFEGEGTIYIQVYRRKTQKGGVTEGYMLNASVTMTDEQCVKEFSNIVDGWFGVHHLRLGAGDKRKPSWICNLSGPRAAEAIKKLYPYFKSDRVKEKALLALKFQDSKLIGTPARNIDYKESRKMYYEKMKTLNKRGKIAAG